MFYCETLDFWLPVSHPDSLLNDTDLGAIIATVSSRLNVPSLCLGQTRNPKQLQVRIMQLASPVLYNNWFHYQ